MDTSNEYSADYLQALNETRAGANWFLWIAALSLVNSALILSGSQWGFVVGLGTTQVFDFIAMALAESLGPVIKLASLGLAALAAGFFAFFGLFARRGHGWAFITGAVFYTLDGLLFLLALDLMSIAFHIIALVFIFKGYRASAELKMLAQPDVAMPPPLPSVAQQTVQSRFGSSTEKAA
jgi:hypothetical protein